MKKNIGTIDRVIRIIVGIGIFSLVFVGPQTAWGYLGLVPIFTALIGWCPLYVLLGINTCGRKAGQGGSCDPKSCCSN